MKKHMLWWIGLFLLLTGLCVAEKVAVLDEILKPTDLSVDADQLYVIEGTTIHIYSLSDYKYLGKFGRAGEGPQEFMQYAEVTCQKDHLLVNSERKLSFFTRKGEFIKESRTGASLGRNFLPIKNGFVAFDTEVKSKLLYFSVGLFDSTFEKQKVIFREEKGFNPGGKINWLSARVRYDVYDNKVFFTDSKDLKIHVVDHTGKPLYSIQEDYPRLKVTAQALADLKDSVKKWLKQHYEAIKPRLVYPDYFPAIRNFSVSDDKVYVITYKGDLKNSEMLIFNVDGKGLKKTTVPFVKKDHLRALPYALGNNKFYQLIENGDEECELHITEIK